jgi:hypothetical protein
MLADAEPGQFVKVSAPGHLALHQEWKDLRQHMRQLRRVHPAATYDGVGLIKRNHVCGVGSVKLVSFIEAITVKFAPAPLFDEDVVAKAKEFIQQVGMTTTIGSVYQSDHAKALPRCGETLVI